MQAEVTLSALADKSRLKIIASLKERPKFVEEIALELNIGVSTASFHLKKLLSAGLVVAKKEQYYQTYSVVEGVMDEELAKLIRTLISDSGGESFKDSVVKECFIDGRVLTLPVQVKKRRVIYEVISEAFEPQKGYSPGEASLIIAERCEDFMTAKREMIDGGLLYEEDGKIYRGKPLPHARI